MTRDQIIAMAREAGIDPAMTTSSNEVLVWDAETKHLERFASLVAASEREAIAEMFDEPMRLVPFVQNHHGGCMICGFTPKHAAAAIRARGQS